MSRVEGITTPGQHRQHSKHTYKDEVADLGRRHEGPAQDIKDKTVWAPSHHAQSTVLYFGQLD